MIPMEERYLHDTYFHQLVDTIRNELEGHRTTASEIREAAMFALMLYERKHPVLYGWKGHKPGCATERREWQCDCGAE